MRTTSRHLQASNKNASCVRASLDVRGLPSPRQRTRICSLDFPTNEIPALEAEDLFQASFNSSSRKDYVVSGLFKKKKKKEGLGGVRT